MAATVDGYEGARLIEVEGVRGFCLYAGVPEFGTEDIACSRRWAALLRAAGIDIALPRCLTNPGPIIGQSRTSAVQSPSLPHNQEYIRQLLMTL